MKFQKKGIITAPQGLCVGRVDDCVVLGLVGRLPEPASINIAANGLGAHPVGALCGCNKCTQVLKSDLKPIPSTLTHMVDEGDFLCVKS